MILGVSAYAIAFDYPRPEPRPVYYGDPPVFWPPATNLPPAILGDAGDLVERCKARAAELRTALAVVDLMRAELETLEKMIAAAEKASTP